MKLSIIIPVFNEAGTVSTLLERVFKQPLPDGISKEIVIVESSSSDGSGELVDAFERQWKGVDANVSFQVVHQEAPRGKGFAMREGLARATGQLVLIQDADLEYDVKDYPALLQPILEGRARFVLGSRHLSAANWKIREFEGRKFRSIFFNLGGFFFHTFFNVLYMQRLTDPTTMYKIFRRECLDGLHFTSNRFDFDFELVAKLIRKGHLPLEIPVSYKSRGFEEGKKIKVLIDPFTWIWAIIKFRFCRL